MDDPENAERDTVNDVLSALARPECRRVVGYFRDRSADTATLEELARACVDEESDLDRTTGQLHHVILPKLDETGIVDYDARSSTVRYHGDPTAEAVLDAIE